MSTTRAFDTLLADACGSLPGLSQDDTQEMAGFGLLIDWVLVKLMSTQNWTLLSQSFKWRADDVLMVVKVRVDETQYVVFVSRPSPIHCMRTLVRKLKEGSVALYPDKYA